VGKTYKDRRNWERKNNGAREREDVETFERKNRQGKIQDIFLDDDDLDDEYHLEYFEE
jgi:hypothetical protein